MNILQAILLFQRSTDSPTYYFLFQVFHLVSFEAMYKSEVPQLVNGIICPNYNVATLEKCAVVIEGVR